MILSFSNEETEQLFHRQSSRTYPSNIQRIMYRKLLLLHAALSIQDLRVPPGNRLEKLKGKRSDEYSIRVNDQWRVCFVWREGNAYDVSIEDYH